MKTLYKDISLEVKDFDEGTGKVIFAVSQYNFKDSDGDIVVPGAFKKTIKENKGRIKHLKFHDTTKSPGTVLNIFDDGDYCCFESQLNLETQIGKETHSEYKSGQITEHSIGYSVIRSSFSKEQSANMLQEVRLWEGSSLLAWGANQNTPLLGIKELEGFTNSDIAEIFQNMKELTMLMKKYDLPKMIELLKSQHPAEPSDTDTPAPLDFDKLMKAMKTNQ